MSHSLRLVGFILLGVVAAHAQMQVHFGVEAGVPITDTLSSSSTTSVTAAGSSFSQFHSVTKRLLIGPSLRLDLPKGLGLEFDALYQRVNYDVTNSISVPATFLPYAIDEHLFEAVTANRWQFPLLVQYSRSFIKTKLFVEGGPATSTIVNHSGTLTLNTAVTSVIGTSQAVSNSRFSGQGGTIAGVTAGGGVDLPLFHMHLRPEFRYSRWFSPSSVAAATSAIGFSSFLLATSPSLPIAKNEATFLVGLTF